MALAALRRPRLSQLVSAALIAIVVVALGVLVVNGQRALTERQAATEATDLRLAVLTIAPIMTTDEMDGRQLDLFEQAVTVLEGDHADVLAGLDPRRRSDAREGLMDTQMHGQMVLAGHSMMGTDHSLASHAGLEKTLRQVAVNASADAATSERRSVTAAALAALAGLLLASRMLAARFRRQSEEVRAETLDRAAKRFSTLLDDSPEATAIINADGEIVYQAASLDELFPNHKLDHRDALIALAVEQDRDGLSDHLNLEGEHRSSLSFRSVLCDGDLPREFTVRVSDLRTDSLVGGWLVALREVTAEVRATRELEDLVETDALTGLPNRRALMHDLEQIDAKPFGFLMIDLDGFKQTNDTFGHDAGDELLQIIAQRFLGSLSDKDRLYRLGGDEFGVVTQLSDDDQLTHLASALIATLDAPVRLSAGFEQAQGSVGVATWNLAGSPRSVLHRADIALYEAKANGGNRLQIVNQELEQRSLRRRELTRALDEANLDAEFSVVYQPIVDSLTGETRYLEALLRWTSPSLGFVGPDQFIPLAESSGQIVDIGIWVLDRACADLAQFRLRGLADHIGVTVNVSPRQLDEDDFSDAVKRVLERHKLAPGDLTIEVTESALVSGSDQDLHPLSQLRALGCHVACDDFGSGYSNLGQLMALPLDLIKVDRELLVHLSEMRELAGGANDQPCQVMSSIVNIGEAMSAPIVAEGVETIDQRRSLESSGVQLLQGYLFSRPLSADDVMDFAHSGERIKELT